MATAELLTSSLFAPFLLHGLWTHTYSHMRFGAMVKERRAFYLHFGKEWKSRKEDVDLYSGNNIHYYYWMCREKQGKPPLIRKECILVRWEKPDSRHTTYAHCQFTHQFGGQRSIQKSCYQICRGRLWRGKNVKLANYLSKWEPFLMGNQEK